MLILFKFSYQVLDADVPHDVERCAQHAVDFHIISCLKARMANWEEENLGDDLFLLSPLTSPESTPENSPAVTPTTKFAQLPVENSDTSQAAEPLPETAQEHLKRRQKVQGHNNRAKRQCLAKLEAREGPDVRAMADAKYAANAAKAFTSTSATGVQCG